MFERDRRSRYAPQHGGNWDPKITITVISLITAVLGLVMIAVIGNSILELINQLIRWFGSVILMIGLIGLVAMTPYWINDHLKKPDKTTALSCLFSKRFERFLIENKLYVINANNTSKIDLPIVELINDGFKISAIGNLRDSLLDDETIGNLNAFLALNHMNRQVIESYYQHGWVHYVVRRDIRIDRLSF